MNKKTNLGFIVILVLLFCKSELYGQTYGENGETINKCCQYSQSNHKGELYLHIAMPLINSFRIVPEDEGTKINTGFTGITYGLDYYHSKNQFVHFDGSTAVTAQFRNAEYGQLSSTYINLSNNHKIKRFSIGYGFSYAFDNSWAYAKWSVWNFYGPIDMISKSHKAFGLIFPIYFHVEKSFYIGIVYRPTFSNKFAYEHLISIDCAWKIELGNIYGKSK